MFRTLLFALLALSPCLPATAATDNAEKPLRWYGYAYGGQFINDDFSDIFQHPHDLDFADSHVLAVGIGKEIRHFGDSATFEVEAQVAGHRGINDHVELNGLGNLRWQKLPWDSLLDTSLAWGLGLSLPSEVPEFERRYSRTSQLLLFMSVEADVMLPGQDDWSAFARIHHRSSALGLVNNANANTDALALGIKRRF